MDALKSRKISWLPDSRTTSFRKSHALPSELWNVLIIHSSDGKAWDFLNEVVLESGNQEIFLDFKASKLLDYIKLIQCDLNGKDLQSEIYKVPRCTKVQWKIVDGILYNPENDAIRIFDLTGRLLKQTMEPELNLYLSLNSGFLVLTDGRLHVEVWCP